MSIFDAAAIGIAYFMSESRMYEDQSDRMKVPPIYE